MAANPAEILAPPDPDGIIALGAVIRGGTPEDDLVTDLGDGVHRRLRDHDDGWTVDHGNGDLG